MLESAEAVAFLPSEDLDRSVKYFSERLELPLLSRSPFACVFSCGPSTLRVTKVDELRPQPFTVFGWLVADLVGTVQSLVAAGTSMLQYEGLDQNEAGIWTTPSGDLVAWFEDPDHNVLSLTELVSR